MSVYVDPMMGCAPNAKWKWNEACHLTADTEGELHAFADKLGLKRAWFQPSPPSSITHYDLTRGMRAKAVKLGAVEIDFHQMGQRVKDAKAQRSATESTGSLFPTEERRMR